MQNNTKIQNKINRHKIIKVLVTHSFGGGY